MKKYFRNGKVKAIHLDELYLWLELEINCNKSSVLSSGSFFLNFFMIEGNCATIERAM